MPVNQSMLPVYICNFIVTIKTPESHSCLVGNHLTKLKTSNHFVVVLISVGRFYSSTGKVSA